MQNKPNITTSQILSLAIPAIFAGIAEPLISLTDLAIIGQIPENSATALAAVGTVGSFLSAIIWTIAQTKTSISSIVSRALGAGELTKASVLIPQAIWLNISLGLLIYVITYFLAPTIFHFYTNEKPVLDIAVSYYKIRAFGFPFTLCAFAIFGIFRGIQNTSWAMIASLTGAAVNIILTYILVLGSPFSESYGIEGAAIASVIAQATLLLVALFFLYKKTSYRITLPDFKNLYLLKKHVQLTTNFFLRTLAINVAIYLSYRYANNYGIEQAATHAILMNIWLFFSFLIDGFANAGNALGGKLLGSKDPDSLLYLSKKTNGYGIAIALILAILCGVAYPFLGHLFTDNSEVLKLLSITFWLVLVMQPINAVAFVYDGIFKGWGEASYLRNLLWILTGFVFIPVLLILDYFNLELFAIWLAFFAWMLGRSILLHLKFKQKIKELL
ncbi:MATE family efflux transporter [Nonlabens sp. SCSIO 43208]|uniref:MATE family efflux transporter n=1 Tax=Nonlabens sp. SCSIO 43208 TaxID=2793009 RepID=UPI002E856F2A|nr:MATE family efflux transporter [Bacteroidota bacterium]